jgi:hypothetical protein
MIVTFTEASTGRVLRRAMVPRAVLRQVWGTLRPAEAQAELAAQVTGMAIRAAADLRAQATGEGS